MWAEKKPQESRASRESASQGVDEGVGSGGDHREEECALINTKPRARRIKTTAICETKTEEQR